MNEWAIRGLGYGIMIAVAIITVVAFVGSVAWIMGVIVGLLTGGADEDENEESDDR